MNNRTVVLTRDHYGPGQHGYHPEFSDTKSALQTSFGVSAVGHPIR